MTDAPDPVGTLPIYGVQLRDAYLLDSRVVRRPQDEKNKLEAPGLEATVRSMGIQSGGRGVDVGIGVTILFPYRSGDYVLELDCTVNGRFESQEERLDSYWQAFASREAIALLWPYVRGIASDIGRLTGLPVPILPTLDVMALVEQPDSTANAGKKMPSRAKRRTAHAATG
jgi:hypothetical protein